MQKVSQYDWAIYEQAIAKAKRQFRTDKDLKKFQDACSTAFKRLQSSPDTQSGKETK